MHFGRDVMTQAFRVANGLYAQLMLNGINPDEATVEQKKHAGRQLFEKAAAKKGVTDTRVGRWRNADYEVQKLAEGSYDHLLRKNNGLGL